MAATLIWLPAASADAVDLERLVSPGPLIAAHEREAESCRACHARFDRSSQIDLCLKCHEDVAGDLERRQGFHGRLPTGSECRGCHGEHEGADADITGLLAESFDHGRTDFPLEGGHAAVACAACHPPDRKRREAPTDCASCHGDDDPHEGRLGERCGSCHDPEAWTRPSFDHDTTKFPLAGRHAEAACQACHPGQRFGPTATECAACHRVDDVHRGRLGPDCAKCHDPNGWKQSGFDHGRETRFPLSGRHAGLDCRRCHGGEPLAPAKWRPEQRCVGCHRSDDDHHGLRGLRCESCHDSVAWSRTRFDHQRDAHFALAGAHAGLACDLCHVGALNETKTPTRCVDCHATVDVHASSLGSDCSSCHGEAGWRERVRFDHGRSDFPLLGLHQLASCEDCHPSARFGEAETACAACHVGADVHEGGLGSGCAHCHNPNGWARWLFDHDRQTKFPLAGGHTGLACRACHRGRGASATPAKAPELSTRCRACHLPDSPHDDAFGRDCERCHVDLSWKQIRRRLP